MMVRKGSEIGSLLRLAAVIAAACALGALAHADPSPSVGEKATAVFDRHCASCHQSGRTNGRPPDRFGNILSLDDIAREENLVLPGRPDASRLYQRIVGAHAPLDAAIRASDGKGPSPEEIEAVRDWIDGLPTREEMCRTRAFVPASASAASMRAWTSRLDPADAAGTRFVSLEHLYNACASEARLKMFREAVEKLLNRLSRRPELLIADTVGDSSTLLAVKLADMGWQAAEWDKLVAGAPDATQGAVRADWLARAALEQAGADRSLEVSVPEIAALAREWEVDVGFYRAAAEAGMEPGPFTDLLRAYRGEEEDLARRLLLGLLKRSEWERLRAKLTSGSGPSASQSGAGMPKEPPSGIDLALWTDNTAYKAGDLVTFLVSASKGCHLTLISVDRDGKAIVLFPNDFETDNAIAPGVTVRIPGAEAGYQVRFDRPGPETLVGICARMAINPEGVTFNYEKQRFAVLGDWRTFLRTTARHEDDGRRNGESRSRKKPKGEPAPIDPDGPALEGRAAITVVVGEAAKP
jgi:mono/diheme cytochrome c family protein